MTGPSTLFNQEVIKCKKCNAAFARSKGLEHIKFVHGWKMGDPYSFADFFEVIK